jgi:hypothetical protein
MALCPLQVLAMSALTIGKVAQQAGVGVETGALLHS